MPLTGDRRAAIRWTVSLLGDRRVKFLIIGAFNTLLGYILFVLCDLLLFAHIDMGYGLSLTVSYCLATLVAFVLYRWFVFSDSRAWTQSLPRFVLVAVLSYSLNALLLILVVEHLGIDRLAGQAIALLVTVIVSYVGHSFYSFGRPRA